MPNTLNIQHQHAVTTVTLRRPEVRNAFDAEMIRELTEVFQEIAAAEGTRVVILAAEGKTFCAGADLNWMRSVVEYRFEENVADAMALARMLQAIHRCPKPVIGRVQGSAFGGGVGLAAACDMTVALDSALFCFSEVKLGIVPAIISPFVFCKVQPGIARRYFLTAEAISSADARRIGLVSEIVSSVEALDVTVNTWVDQLTANGPEALAACKRLVDEIAGPDWEEVLALAARRIAERRASAEGQEGMKAFLEKRQPAWSGVRRVP